MVGRAQRAGLGAQDVVGAAGAGGEAAQVLGPGRGRAPAATPTRAGGGGLSVSGLGRGDRDVHRFGRWADRGCVLAEDRVPALLQQVAVVVLLLPGAGDLAALLLLGGLLLEPARPGGDLTQPGGELGGIGSGGGLVVAEQVREVSLEVLRGGGLPRGPRSRLPRDRRGRTVTHRDQPIGHPVVERDILLDRPQITHETSPLCSPLCSPLPALAHARHHTDHPPARVGDQ